MGLAFGLAILAAAYTFGHVSGAHLNPAITLGQAEAILAFFLMLVVKAPRSTTARRARRRAWPSA